MKKISKKSLNQRVIMPFLNGCFVLFVALSSLWLCLALWIHQPLGHFFSLFIIVSWVVLALSICGIFFTKAIFKPATDVFIYLCCFAIGLIWFFSMPAKNERAWNPEVAKILDYQQRGNLITIENVRNFQWRAEDDYDIQWETRQYDLSKIESMDLVLSYWSTNQIAHTLISFNFKDGRHLAFSIEIRKEINESFSTIGGFFRQYELAIVPADEKDIIYTRSNIRNERVYIYPVKISKAAMQELFLSYLQQGKALQTNPRWYNTLLSNCTTIIFDMVNKIEPVPIDYRVLLSGLLPYYLYDEQALDPQYSIKEWMQMAHVNPKVQNFEQLNDQSSQNYSRLIRSGLP